MAFEVGQIVDGKVTGIMNYGAFIDLGDGTSGMVHISEIAPTYVKEIKDHLTVGQQVKVKILAVDERGKISLSIKQAMPKPQNNGKDFKRSNNGGYNKKRGGRQGTGNSRPDNFDWNRKQNSSDNFDDMLLKFMASSDEKISGLKKQQGENRRSRKGGNNGGNQW
jgi:S1 RNA binding domain protein